VCISVFLNYVFFSLSRISFDLVQAFGTEGMNTKDLTRFGKGSCQKPRLVEILLKSRKHKYENYSSACGTIGI
jgi:hypothetical protein